MSTNYGEEPQWKLGPLSISRTTDILAFVAFILSVIGLIAELRDYVRGPDIVLLPPEQIVIGNSSKLGQNFGSDVVVITATMSYVNVAPPGFNAAIGKEYLRFTFDGREYQYFGHEFGTVGYDSEKKKDRYVKKEDFGPFAVNAGSAVSHETLFVPHPIRCDHGDQKCKRRLPMLLWDKFKKDMARNTEIEITLVADVYGKTTTLARCKAVLDKYDIPALADDDKQVRGPNCFPVVEQSGWERIFLSYQNSGRQSRAWKGESAPHATGRASENLQTKPVK